MSKISWLGTSFAKVGRVVELPVKFVFFIIGVFAFFVLKILQPLIKIRIGCLQYDRIGPFSSNTELYLRRRARDNNAARERHIFVSGKPANSQLLKMIKRRMRVHENRAFAWTYNAVRSFFSDSDLWIDTKGPYDPDCSDFYSLFNNISPQLAFTPQEEMRGKQLLKKMGIKEGLPFVCFYARDKAYLDKIHSHYSREKWSYQDIRNCNIENYFPAVKYLTSLGMHAVRMGYVVERALINDDPRIIDYATHYRTDFGDIYLSAKCKFFLTSDGGLNSVPWIFNVPVTYCNCSPPLEPAWRKGDIFMPPKLWSYEKKRFLTFREITSYDIWNWRARHYKQTGIELVENTPEEILMLVEEMNERLDGTWVTSSEDEELQQRYRMIFPKEHRFYGFLSGISVEFLRQNKDLLK